MRKISGEDGEKCHKSRNGVVRQEGRDEHGCIEFVDPAKVLGICLGKEVYNANLLLESPNKPFYGLDSGHQPQARTDKPQKRVYLLVKLCILCDSHLSSVFILTLLAEQRISERRKTGV